VGKVEGRGSRGGTTAGDSCMWEEIHGWTDDVISGVQTVIDIAYISTRCIFNRAARFRKREREREGERERERERERDPLIKLLTSLRDSSLGSISGAPFSLRSLISFIAILRRPKRPAGDENT